MNGVHLYKVEELQVVGNICVVTEGTTLLFITQVSSGLKIAYVHLQHKYFHVKIASLANVIFCVTVGPIH